MTEDSDPQEVEPCSESSDAEEMGEYVESDADWSDDVDEREEWSEDVDEREEWSEDVVEYDDNQDDAANQTTDKPAEAVPPTTMDAGSTDPLHMRAQRELSALESVLRKTRRQLRAPLFAEGLAWMLATTVAVLITAQFVGLALGTRGPATMRYVLVVGLGATAIGALVALLGFIRTAPSLRDIANTIQRELAEFRSDIVAALEFGDALSHQDATPAHFSASLAFAHLRKTTRAVLAATESGSLAPRLEPRSLAPSLLATGGALAVLLLPFALMPDKLPRLWHAAAFAPLVEAASDADADHRPVVGDIDLMFSYPPYTGLPQHMEPFTTGHISTLVGTEVTLRTYPLVNASKFELVITTPDGERIVPMKFDAGDEVLSATLLLTRSGSYQFRATMPDESVVSDGIDRPIVLEPDQVPAIIVDSHTGEVEVSPDEVLTLSFNASDDFGLESVSRAAAFGAEDANTMPIEIPELATTPRSVRGEVELDLRQFALQPKDTLTVWFEAVDNNSLTGPGVGKSAPLVLRVASPDDRHERLIAEEMEVLEALLDVLADVLENPIGERQIPEGAKKYGQKIDPLTTTQQSSEHHARTSDIAARQREALAMMATVLEKMKEDPLMTKRDVTLFESLYEQLYAVDRAGTQLLEKLAPDARAVTITQLELQKLADWLAEDEDTLEKGLIRLDNLLVTQKMDSVRRAADELKDLKERLKELLQRYKETQDPELKQAIMREIQRMRQRMSELMRRMSSQLERIPREHVNMEALQQAQLESETQKMGDGLQQVEDLLEKGDIDGALAALEQINTSLDAMTQEMDEQFAQAEPQGMREMDQVVSKLMDQTDDLTQRQTELEQRTREHREMAETKNRKQMEQMLAQRTSQLEALAKQQREALESMQKLDLFGHDREHIRRAARTAQELEENIRSRDIEDALEKARRSAEQLREMQFAMDLSARYADPASARGRDSRKAMNGAEQARPRADKIVEGLEDVMKQAQAAQRRAGSEPELRKLAQEQRDVDAQAEQLERSIGEASERFPMLGQKLQPSIEGARQEMGQSADALDGQKAQQSLDHQRGALQQLRELKQSMRNAMRGNDGDQMGQNPGRRTSKRVAIPKKAAPTEDQFRGHVMDGMKQERLQEYDSEIQRYYEALMK